MPPPEQAAAVTRSMSALTQMIMHSRNGTLSDHPTKLLRNKLYYQCVYIFYLPKGNGTGIHKGGTQ
jgi:hypothetical protein